MVTVESTPPLQTRVWLHRIGALDVPGINEGYAVFSSAASLTNIDGFEWKHVYVQPGTVPPHLNQQIYSNEDNNLNTIPSHMNTKNAAANYTPLGLPTVPEGILNTCFGPVVSLPYGSQLSPSSSSGSATTSVKNNNEGTVLPVISPYMGYGFSMFLNAAVSQLQSSLQSIDRQLDILTTVLPTSSSSSTSSTNSLNNQSSSIPHSNVTATLELIIQYAKQHKATEIHTIMSRDPWTMETDFLLRTLASQSNIALILHDECYLVHPHRLLTSTAVSDMRKAGSSSVNTSNSGTDNSSSLSSVSSLSSSSSSSSVAASSLSSVSSSSSSSASFLSHDHQADAPLPPHLRSFDIFTRGLRVAPDVRDGRKSRPTNTVSSPVASSISSSNGSNSNVSPTEQAFLDYPTVRYLFCLHQPYTMINSLTVQNPTLAEDVVEQSNRVSVAISNRRLAQGSTPLTSLQHCIVLIASHIYNRCFNTATMDPSAKHSVYIRQQYALPLLQSLVSIGLVSPRQLWHGTSSLVRCIADLLHALMDAKEAAKKRNNGGNKNFSSPHRNARGISTSSISNSSNGTPTTTVVNPTVVTTSSVPFRTPPGSHPRSGTRDSMEIEITEEQDTIDSNIDDDTIGIVETNTQSNTGNDTSSVTSYASLSNIQMSAYRGTVKHKSSSSSSSTVSSDTSLSRTSSVPLAKSTSNGDNYDGGLTSPGETDTETVNASADEDTLSSNKHHSSSSSKSKSRSKTNASVSTTVSSTEQDMIESIAKYVDPPYSMEFLKFLLEYTLRLLRWLSLREYSSHILYFKPHLAYSPGRIELSPLPWATIPNNDVRPNLSHHHPIINTVNNNNSTATMGTGNVPLSTATWWYGNLPPPSSTSTTAANTSINSSMIPSFPVVLPLPTLPSVSVTLPSLPTIPITVPVSWTIDSPEAALAKSLRTIYETNTGSISTSSSTAVFPSLNQAVQNFIAGLSGYPLVDSCLVAIEATGHLPHVALPVLVNTWCKHFGKPWHDLMRWLLLRSIDTDVPLMILRYQWMTGLAAGCDWSLPIDAPDVLNGIDIELSPPLEIYNWEDDTVNGSSTTRMSSKMDDNVPNKTVEPSQKSTGTNTLVPIHKLQLLYRFHPQLPPHVHLMGHPAGLEFASEPDNSGLFVRMCLSHGKGNMNGLWLTNTQLRLLNRGNTNNYIGLAPNYPDAVIYDPGFASRIVNTSTKQELRISTELVKWLRTIRHNSSSSASLAITEKVIMSIKESLTVLNTVHPSSGHPNVSTNVTYYYPNPVTSLARTREKVVETTSQLYRYCKPRASVFSVVNDALNTAMGGTKPINNGTASNNNNTNFALSSSASLASSPRSPAAALDVQAHAYVQAQVTAGCSREWGMVNGWPLTTEEDGSVLMSYFNLKPTEGWSELLEDTEKRLKVYSQQRNDITVRPHVANLALARHTEPEVHDAVANLQKYGQWDLSWAHTEHITYLDPFTEVTYMIGDAPPAPYSYVITQRDFCLFRHKFYIPSARLGIVYFRSGAHAAKPSTMSPTNTYIRAEVVGVVGFVTRRMDLCKGYTIAHQCTPSSNGLGNENMIIPSNVPLLLPSSGTSLYSPLPTYTPGPYLSPPQEGITHLFMYAAGDPKGTIPTYLINFVAKRTPRMWTERLMKFCDKFREEEENKLGNSTSSTNKSSSSSSTGQAAATMKVKPPPAPSNSWW